MYGKSHMGSAWPGCLPTARGFDDFNGFLQGCGNYKTHQAAQCSIPVNPLPPSGDDDQFPPPDGEYDGYDWFSGTEINTTANGTYSEWLVRDRAVEFLDSIAAERAEGKGREPFYLYLPFQNIHVPLEVQDRYRRMYPGLQHDAEMQTLSGMITAVDDAIGAVLARLSSSGLSDNALVWLHSDNGAPPVADTMRRPNYLAVRNFPLRGWKTQVSGPAAQRGRRWNECAVTWRPELCGPDSRPKGDACRPGRVCLGACDLEPRPSPPVAPRRLRTADLGGRHPRPLLRVGPCPNP